MVKLGFNILIVYGCQVTLLAVLMLLYLKILKPILEKKHIIRLQQRARLQHTDFELRSVRTDEERPGTPVFAIELAEDYHTPTYWSKLPKGFKNIDITSEAWFVTLLVYKLWCPGLVGIGRDAKDVGDHKFIQITKVQRVENVELLMMYNNLRQRLLEKKKIVQGFKDLSEHSSSPVKTTFTIQNDPELSKSPLEIDIDHSINEHYLFHGTLTDKVNSICRIGLSTFYSIGGLFGKGVYCTENPTKANQYTDGKITEVVENRSKKIILCRVCMGQNYISKDPKENFDSVKCSTCDSLRCRQHQYTYDSAVFERPGLRFREFVVYKDYMIYPEYIITYDRVKSDKEMTRFMKRYNC